MEKYVNHSSEDSLAIDESIELILNNHRINKLVKDCRYTDKYWAYNMVKIDQHNVLILDDEAFYRKDL
ncbi:hypothetical protein [Clostridium sp.]|uniref:hypothetical protein n=1 Tax=Clostridium sp. TaxID=1506 RepID=UPI003977A0EA